MKHLPLIFIFSLIFLTACQESKKSSSSSSNPLTNCNYGSNYWSLPGCPGYTGTTGMTQGGTVGGTTGTNQQCFGNNYYYYPGCPGYCSIYPGNPACANGGTTGGTTGSTQNPYDQIISNPIYANWGVHYPPTGTPPQGQCAPAYAPSGISYTPYETRKAVMSIQGKTFYSPASPIASNYMNTSSLLKSVTSARTLFSTDSVLKVRFKVLPQPENTSSSPYCYIPNYTNMSQIPGYTKLQFNVQLVGVRANGSTATEYVGDFTTGVNSCTPAIDLSSYASTYPGGIYLIVQSVRSNQGPTNINYTQYGFGDSNSFTDVRSMDCWSLQVEVAADGTKTFD